MRSQRRSPRVQRCERRRVLAARIRPYTEGNPVTRHRNFLSQAIRVSGAVARQHAAAVRREQVASARAQRERERELRRRALADRQSYLANRASEAETLNEDLIEQVDELRTLLTTALRDAKPLNFGLLKWQPDETPFDAGRLATVEPPPTADKYVPPALVGLSRLLPWARRAHEQATELALRRVDDDLRKHQVGDAAREL